MPSRVSLPSRNKRIGKTYRYNCEGNLYFPHHWSGSLPSQQNTNIVLRTILLGLNYRSSKDSKCTASV
jgi:hypothetical protein